MSADPKIFQARSSPFPNEYYFASGLAKSTWNDDTSRQGGKGREPSICAQIDSEWLVVVIAPGVE